MAPITRGLPNVWELNQYSCQMSGPLKNPIDETRSRDSNSGPHDCKADALPHDQPEHFRGLHFYFFSLEILLYYFIFFFLF